MSYSDEIRKALDSNTEPPTPDNPVDITIDKNLLDLSKAISSITIDPYRLGWLHHNAPHKSWEQYNKINHPKW